MREHPHSSQQCINFPHHDDHLKPLLPDSIVTANSQHATSQTEKTNESQAQHHRLYNMGLRTVYQSRYPNIDCHPSTRRRSFWRDR
ncbi:hypothetical protein TNCV_977571 [Trichonephila clavipes]|nr:hypothetical protein TNCV_977571 [Trichonephila clavipes]